MAGNIFEVNQKVYFAATDSLGIVYYSRYLEWLEMARIEFLTKMYKPMTQMMAEDKICFMPISLHINYKAAAVFEDSLKIKLFFKTVDKAKLILVNGVFKEVHGKEILISDTEMILICLNMERGNRLTKIPDHLVKIFKNWELKHYSFERLNITA